MPLVRSNLEQTSYLRKLLSYRAIVSQTLQKTHLNIPNLFVLTLTNNEQHMKNIMNLFGEISPEGSKLFLFKTAMEPQLFGRAATPEPMTIEQPWQRVGFEPFALNKL